MGAELDRQIHETEAAVAIALGEQAANDAVTALKERRRASDVLAVAIAQAVDAATGLTKARAVASDALDAADGERAGHTIDAETTRTQELEHRFHVLTPDDKHALVDLWHDLRRQAKYAADNPEEP